MKYSILIVAVLAGVMFITPGGVEAQGLVPCSGPDCDACDAVKLVNDVINWLIGFLAVLAVIIMVFAGFRMVTSGGDVTAWTQGKQMFTNVVIGIILVLASWLIVDTILTALTNKGGLELWGSVECTEIAITQSEDGTKKFVAGTSGAEEVAKRSFLNSQGIDINHVACTGTQTTGCTNIGGMNDATLDAVVLMRSECGASCDMVVTGGSEGGHAGGTAAGTHGGGDKFDLRPTSSVSEYILGDNFETNTVRSRSGRLNSDVGVFCVDEGNHWDCLKL